MTPASGWRYRAGQDRLRCSVGNSISLFDRGNVDNESTDAVVAQIYCAASESQSWRVVLDSISVACGAFVVQLLGIDRPTGNVAFIHVGGVATRHDDPAHLLHRGLWAAPALAPDRQGWWHCHEYVNQEQVATSLLHQAYLIPIGGRYISAMPIAFDDETGVLLSVMHGVGQGPLNAASLRWLDRLLPHLVQALQIHRQLGAQRKQAAAGQAILNRMVHPVLLVDASMALCYANAAGQGAINAGLTLRVTGGQLLASDPSDDMALRVAIAGMCTTATDHDKPGRRFLHLRGTHARHHVGASLSMLQAAETHRAFGPKPLVLLVLSDGNLDAACDPLALQTMFGLTLAEAQVAVLLVQGETMTAIAVRRGVTISTVRTQVNTLKSKIGSKRQIDLTRRLLTLQQGFSAA